MIQADDFGILDFVVKILHFSCFIFWWLAGNRGKFWSSPECKGGSRIRYCPYKCGNQGGHWVTGMVDVGNIPSLKSPVLSNLFSEHDPDHSWSPIIRHDESSVRLAHRSGVRVFVPFCDAIIFRFATFWVWYLSVDINYYGNNHGVAQKNFMSMAFLGCQLRTEGWIACGQERGFGRQVALGRPILRWFY